MQPSHITQYQKNEELNHKMGRRPKQTFPQTRQMTNKDAQHQ